MTKLFISHSHRNNLFCQELAYAIRQGGGDPWYDQHEIGMGGKLLTEEIDKALQERRIFILVLSQPAEISKWVKRECLRAQAFYNEDPPRQLFAVRLEATPQPNDTLRDFVILEESPGRPYPLSAIIPQTLNALNIPIITYGNKPERPQSDEIQRLKRLADQGRFTEAIEPLRNIVFNSPDFTEGWIALAGILRARDRNDDALFACKRALFIEPHNIFALLEEAILLSKAQRNTEALQVYNEILSQENTQAVLWIGRGEIYLRLQDIDRAQRDFEMAMTLTPHSFLPWRYLGLAFLQRKDYQKALDYLETSLIFATGDEIAWALKAEAYMGLGEKNEAKDAFKRALEINPNNRFYPQRVQEFA